LQDKQLICIGKVSGVFGIQGWLKVFSYTGFKENILTYTPWLLKKAHDSRIIKITDGKLHGKLVIVKLDGVDDRDQAASFIGYEIFISHAQLPETSPGEYYWADLIGLQVETTHGIQLGLVTDIMETGANDVLVVKGERDRAIPFLQGSTVTSIDIETGKIIVDWDADF
jgi:16S rRNA processing protein RimM